MIDIGALALRVPAFALAACLLAMPAAAATPAPVTWTFDAASAAAGWAAERGRLIAGDGGVRLQPDSNRRVILLSPPSLPANVQDAGEFVLGVGGTGLMRVRIQGRRDERGGWITLAEGSGGALRETPEGVVVRRRAATPPAPVERLRIEMEFRTTNLRPLERIVARPASP